MGKSLNQNNKALIKMTTPPRREPRMKKSIKLESISYDFSMKPKYLFLLQFPRAKKSIAVCEEHIPTLFLTRITRFFTASGIFDQCNHCMEYPGLSATLSGRKVGIHPRLGRRK